MSKVKKYFTESLNAQSPAMPVRIVTGLCVGVMGFVWLPLGVLGLLGLIWLVYVTNPIEMHDINAQNGKDILVPMDGLITFIEADAQQIRIRISQQFHSNKLIHMPCDGRIEINMFVDGLFLPTQISNASRLNARREITINTHKMSNPLHSEDEISLIMWGRPFARYLSSPISEGRIMQSGVPIAISLIQGDLDVILPANYNVLVKSGEFCLAGKTILARAG